MLEAGLLDTALINSYNSFWLALLAKRSFFLTVKERYLRKPTFNNLCDPFGSPSGGQKPQGREDVAGYAIASARVLVSSAEPVP